MNDFEPSKIKRAFLLFFSVFNLHCLYLIYGPEFRKSERLTSRIKIAFSVRNYGLAVVLITIITIIVVNMVNTDLEKITMWLSIAFILFAFISTCIIYK